jgi:preprotein translocase subunit YajC
VLSQNSLLMLGFVVVFIGIFYFMVMRPQQKRYKAQQELMSSIKKGDKVMLTAGIYGTVKKVEDKVIEVEIAKDTSVKVIRGAIREVIRDKDAVKAIGTTGGTRTTRAKAEASEETKAAKGDEAAEDGEES